MRVQYPARERGGADNDKPYRFRLHPLTYLSTHQYARLQIRWPRREQVAE